MTWRSLAALLLASGSLTACAGAELPRFRLLIGAQVESKEPPAPLMPAPTPPKDPEPLKDPAR